MSFPKYAEYRSTDHWFGDVPTHWRKTSLKYVASYQNGYAFKPEDWSTDGLPIIRIAQLTGDSEPNRYEGELDGRLKVEDGDLLFSWSATIDSFIWNGGPAWLNQHIFKVTPTAEANQGFLFYMIKHVAPKLADVDAHGSTMQHIKKESLGETVFVPNRREQNAISSFLDAETSKIDALVAEQRHLIELLKEKRQAVISHAVTKGLNLDAPMKPSGIEWLGDVPEHWEVHRMGVLYSEEAESGNNDLPVLQVSIHRGVSDRELTENESDRKITRIEDKSKYKRVIPNDLVYNMMRAWQGGFGAVKVEGMVSPAYVVARPKRSLITQYIEYLFRTPQAIEQMRRYSHGVTDFRLRLYWGKFKNVRIALPSKNEQRAICDRIEEISLQFDRLAAEAKLAIDLLQERRTALISAAVTGKIDVRGYQSSAAA